jgi:hypothetical protein
MVTDHGKVAGSLAARFMERRGRRIEQACGALWYSVPGRLYMSLPHQLEVQANPKELTDFLLRRGALGVRFPSTDRPGLPSGLYVCMDKEYGLKSVQPRLRSMVRRGLERCEIREATSSELLEYGLEMNRGTMRRQGRYDAEFGEVQPWRRLVNAVEISEGIRAYGAFVDKRLAAYVITCREDGWLHILHQNSSITDLEHYPNHALDYWITSRISQEAELECVCFGLIGLVYGQGLDDYKRRLGYSSRPLNSVFVLNPLCSAIANTRLTMGVVRGLRARYPANQKLERISTVLEGAAMSRAGVEGGNTGASSQGPIRKLEAVQRQGGPWA